MAECLVLMGERGLSDFDVRIEGEAGTVQVCVRDHECEDGDEISVDVEGQNLFSGEIVNDWVCRDLDVEAGRSYAIEMTALNGTGYKGACSFADVNTGEIRVSGENVETQVWRHRGGSGSLAQIVVTTAVPQPFTVVPTPKIADVSFVGMTRAYEAGMRLGAGEYRVRVSARGYETREVAVRHGPTEPTRVDVKLEQTAQPGDTFTDALASGNTGPEMVVIPAGSFRMGCVSGRDCNDREKPVHDVRIPQPFALSKYEVTFAEWDACVSAGGCGSYWSDSAGLGARQPSGDQCELGGCAGVRVVVVATDRGRIPNAERVGVGIRGAGWWHGAIQLGARYRVEQSQLPGRPLRRPMGIHRARRFVCCQCIWTIRHARQRVGVGGGLLEQQITTGRRRTAVPGRAAIASGAFCAAAPGSTTSEEPSRRLSQFGPRHRPVHRATASASVWPGRSLPESLPH